MPLCLFAHRSKRGLRQQVCYSQKDVLINESHVSNLRLLRSAVVLQRCKGPVSSMPASLNGTTWYRVSVPSLLTAAHSACRRPLHSGLKGWSCLTNVVLIYTSHKLMNIPLFFSFMFPCCFHWSDFGLLLISGMETPHFYIHVVTLCCKKLKNEPKYETLFYTHHRNKRCQFFVRYKECKENSMESAHHCSLAILEYLL